MTYLDHPGDKRGAPRTECLSHPLKCMPRASDLMRWPMAHIFLCSCSAQLDGGSGLREKGQSSGRKHTFELPLKELVKGGILWGKHTRGSWEEIKWQTLAWGELGHFHKGEPSFQTICREKHLTGGLWPDPKKDSSQGKRPGW